MNLLTIDLSQKLLAANRRILAADTAVLAHQTNLDAQIEKLRIGAEKTFKDGETLDAARILGFQYKTHEAAQIAQTNAHIAHLPQDRIFTADAIRDLCCAYGLRFLPTSLYKGALDEQIPAKLAEFKALNGGRLPNQTTRLNGAEFCIAAPAASFVLSERSKDPLLFANLGANRWYLIHKWGDDLSIGARLKQMLMNHWMVMWLLLMIPICLWVGVSHTDAGTYLNLFFVMGALISSILWCVGMVTSGIEDWRVFGDRVTTHRNWDSQFRS